MESECIPCNMGVMWLHFLVFVLRYGMCGLRVMATTAVLCVRCSRLTQHSGLAAGKWVTKYS